MFNNLIGKNKELGRFLFCERYTLPPVKNAMYIAEGQELKRGAVVDVNGVLVGTNSLMPYAVLEFDCDTRSGGKEASVFVKGEFNFDKLYFADGLDQSDLDNIVYNGSGLGIVIKPYEYAEGFSPLMVQQSSNIAPTYTKKTYEANSYVMQDGVLYTNPNAIGTAEDWNPEHWTQTTVAEMMAGAGGGYKEVNLTFGINDTKTVPVGQKEDVYVECTVRASDRLVIQLAADCTDAVIRFKRLNAVRFNSFTVKRGNDVVHAYGQKIMTDVSTSVLYESFQVLLTSKFEEGEHGSSIPTLPTDFSEMELNSDPIVSDVNARNVGYELTTANISDSWLFVVKGRAVFCLPD